jgi:hypothetical protein
MTRVVVDLNLDLVELYPSAMDVDSPELNVEAWMSIDPRS